MTVIDLGELRGRTTDEPPAELPPGRRRNAALVVVAVLALLLTAAAAPVVGPFTRLGTIHARPGDPLYVAGSVVYLVRIQEKPAVVDAYDIRDGSLRWSVPYPFDASEVPDQVQLDVAGGRLILGAVDPSTLTNSVVALDAATGRARWRVGNEYAQLDARRMLVGDESQTRLSVMDRVTGKVSWTIPFLGCVIGAIDDADTVAIQCDGGGTLRLLDTATGRVEASRDLTSMVPASWGIPVEDRAYAVSFVGDVVTVRYGSESIGLIDGLNRGDLSTRWSKSVVSPDQGYVFDCDGDVCVDGPAGGIRLDADTGTRLPGGIDNRIPPDATYPLDVLGGNGRTRPPAVVLNPQPPASPTLASGRDALFDMYDGQNRMPVFAGAYPTWVLRAVPDRAAAYGYRFTTVGKLDGVLATACFTTTRYLACSTATNTLTFFDLPPEDRAR